jgi:hypothetical protein
MTRMVLTLLSMAVLLCGCFDKTVIITSNPTDAGVYSNQDRLGNTPLLTSKNEIMPLWTYYLIFTQSVISIRKPGYEDYMVNVNEYTLPGEIHADLVPIKAQGQFGNGKTPDVKESLENRLFTLQQLFDKGAISKEEYDAKRKEILGGL